MDTALIIAARIVLFKTVGFLLDNGADPDMKEIYGSSAIVEAVKKKNIEMVKLLLDKGANMEIRDNNRHPLSMQQDGMLLKVVQKALSLKVR